MAAVQHSTLNNGSDEMGEDIELQNYSSTVWCEITVRFQAVWKSKSRQFGRLIQILLQVQSSVIYTTFPIQIGIGTNTFAHISTIQLRLTDLQTQTYASMANS